MIQLLLRLEMLKSLTALMRNYSEFIFLANSPSTITFRYFAKKLTINFMRLHQYSVIWTKTNSKLDVGVHYMPVLILPFTACKHNIKRISSLIKTLYITITIPLQYCMLANYKWISSLIQTL